MKWLGSLCAGVGGLDEAVMTHFGVQLAWYSEVDPAACKVLEARYPGVPNLGDLTAVEWERVPPVDVMCAGYPCQPFSVVGQRRGANDPRHLWPFIYGALRILRPSRLVAENVAGHILLGFDRVLGDLAAAGFDAEWTTIRASDVGAAHRRERLFVVATDTRGERRPQDRRGAHSSEGPLGVGGHDHQSRCHGTDSSPDGPVEQPHWGRYESAIRRHEQAFGRRAPAAIDAKGRLSVVFTEWLMGFPEGWVTDIITSRTAALRLLGNAVVTRQALAALAHLAPLDQATEAA